MVPCSKMLNCIVLYCIVLYCIVLYCTVLHCIVLYCIVLYCIVVLCSVSFNGYCLKSQFDTASSISRTLKCSLTFNVNSNK